MLVEIGTAASYGQTTGHGCDSLAKSGKWNGLRSWFWARSHSLAITYTSRDRSSDMCNT